jgi:hypothetical protein
MNSDTERARLRARYADLLDSDQEEELHFIGALDAAYARPPLPDKVQAILNQHAWHNAAVPLPGSVQPRKDRHISRRLRDAIFGETAIPTQAPVAGRWGNLHQILNAATTIVLVVGIALAALFLLRDSAMPSQGSVPANGNWLYPGSLNGRSGIISVAADGTAQLLIEGGFYGVTPSPDGQRLIAYGNREAAIWPEPGTAAALYTADGQLLRRYTLGGATPLIPYWSPDSQHIAFFARLGLGSGNGSDFRTWLLDENGEHELQLGQRTLVGTSSGTGVWSSRGELLVSVIAADSNGDGMVTTVDRQATWIVGTDGNSPRRLHDETAATLGWSSDGLTAYLLGATTLMAVDVRSGTSERVAHFDNVATALRSAAMRQGIAAEISELVGFSYGPAAIAPSGDRFAIWLIPEISEVATSAASAYMVVIDRSGQIIGITRGEADMRPRFVAWSPDSARVAYSYIPLDSELATIRVLNSTEMSLADTPSTRVTLVNQSADGMSLRWSPDSRQLAYTLNGSVEIASGTALAVRRTLPGFMYGWPNWLPIP